MAGSTVVVSVLADTKRFTSGMDSAAGGLGKLGGAFSSMAKVAGVAALATAGVVAAIGVASFKALANIEKLNAQTTAAIKSTGAAAGRSLEQITGLADELEKLTGIEAEAIQGGQNLLLTFTNINGDNFDKATKAALDMSVAMGQDMTSAATLVGKALNDPIGGISALSRVGVQLTDDQKAVIASLVELGDTAGAQAVILAELNKQFGGSAEAFGGTFLGTVEKVKNAWGTLGETLTEPLLIPVTGALAQLNDALLKVGESPAFLALADRVAELVAGLDIEGAGTRLLDGLESLAAFFTGGGASSVLSQGTAIFDMLAEAGDSLRGPLGEALRGILADLAPLVPALVDELTPALSALIPAFADLVIALLPLLPPLAQLAAAILPPLAAALSDMVGVVAGGEGGGFIDFLAGLIGWLSTPTGEWLADVSEWIASLGPQAGPLAALVAQFASLFDGARHGGDVIANLVNTITEAVGSIPGRVQAALAGAGEWLVQSGQALIRGFISGIESTLGEVGSAVGGVMSFIAGFFPSSPAKRGPFSGAGWSRIGAGGSAIAGEFLGGFKAAATGLTPIMRGIATDLSGALVVTLPTPNLGAGTATTTHAAATQNVTNISVVQNNPVTRDPLKQLREDSENLAAGIWA